MINRILAVSTLAGALVLPLASLSAQDLGGGRLASVETIKCTFPLMTLANWGDDGQPRAEVKPANLTMQFEAVNTDEGSAELASGFGTYDIIVRYAGIYLNFIQSFRDGPLYSTTILEKESTAGKFKAMHSRHEHADFALTGFTSSPEQYYGECEILN